MLFPSVAFLKGLRLEVVQASSAEFWQPDPVKPLAQTHRHELADTTDVPPLAQGLVKGQFERSIAAAAFDAEL